MNKMIEYSKGKIIFRTRLSDLLICFLIITALAFFDIKPIFLGAQALAIVQLLYQIFRTGSKRHVTVFMLWLVAVCGFSLASKLWASSGNRTVISVTLSIAQVGLIACSILVYCREMKYARRVITYIVLAALFLCVRFFIEIPVSIWGQGMRFPKKSIFGGNGPAMTLAYTAVLLLWLMQTEKTTVKKKRLLLLGVALFMFISMMTGTRKGIIIFAVGVICLLIGNAKNPFNMFGRVVLGAGLLVLFYILIMKVPLFYRAIGYRMESLIKGLQGLETDNSSADRFALMKDAMQKFSENPLIGLGQDGYRYVSAVRIGFYSHNNYTEILANQGLIGFGLFYGMYVYLFVRSVSIRKKCLLPLCVLLMMFATEYAAVSYSNERTYILLGLIAALNALYKEDGGKPRRLV